MLVPNLEFTHFIKDSVWEDIPLTELEWGLIQTKAFNRLRHIRQMGLAYLGFPAANHRRYEHCLGAMHAAYSVFKTLVEGLPDQVPDHIKDAISDRNLQAFRVAALLHDIGHPPYSHVVERLFARNPQLLLAEGRKALKICRKFKNAFRGGSYSHEEFSKYLILSDKEIHQELEKFRKRSGGYHPSEIADLSVGRSNISVLSIYNSLVSGDLDVDKIDYILRDSYYCGFPQKFDVSLLRGNLLFKEEGETIRLLLKPEGLLAIDSLLLARYELIKCVHLNPTNRIAMQMLIDLLYSVLNELSEVERINLIIRMHTEMTDSQLEEYLCRKNWKTEIENILNGKIYKEYQHLEFEQLHPFEKISTYILLRNPTYISQVERNIREKSRINALLFDVNEAKPPKFSTPIDDGRGERNVFDNYYTPHGILIDSLNSLRVSVYGPDDRRTMEKMKRLEEKEFKATIRQPQKYELKKGVTGIITDALVKVARKCREDLMVDNVLQDLDLLLAVAHYVYKHCKEHLHVDGDPWIYSDGKFQTFVRHILEDLKRMKKNVKSEYGFRKNFSIALFRDLEVLINSGLMEHVHRTVGLPLEGFELLSYKPRLDRRISGWGRLYCETELPKIYEVVKDIVYGKQDRVSVLVKQLITKEKEQETLGPDLNSREEINKILDRNRKTIVKQGGCPITVT
ncbi:MAG TPA: hypothetical protein DHV62_07085 [Elusimicrobia bacterium]|jgi:hypothetical protein|nr:hypothetical protein [Elusimicrobiota bacterium]